MPNEQRQKLVPGITKASQWPTSKAQAKAVSSAYQKALAAYRKSGKPRPCYYCGYVSKHNELVDDDAALHKTSGQRWRVICSACHGYLRIGQNPVQGLKAFTEGFYGKTSRLLHSDPQSGPSAKVLNHLYRVIGMAMLDEQTGEMAQKLYNKLASQKLVEQTKVAFGTNLPSEMHNALKHLSKQPQRYKDRGEALQSLRLIYHPDVIKRWGARLKDEVRAESPSNWRQTHEEKLQALQKYLGKTLTERSVASSAGGHTFDGPQSLAELGPNDDDFH